MPFRFTVRVGLRSLLVAALLAAALLPAGRAQVPLLPGPGQLGDLRGQVSPPRKPPATSPCVWLPGAENPLPRIEAASAVLRGRLHVLGGFTTTALQASSLHDVYDPQRDRWTSHAPLPQPVTHAGCATTENSLWLAGGFLGNHPGPVVAEVFRYDSLTDAWRQIPSLPEPRGSGVLLHHEGRLHWFGGVGTNKEVDQGEHWVHQLGSQTWTPLAPLPGPRNHLSGAVLDGLLYAVGGQNRHDNNPADLNLVHRYDPQTDAWTAVQSLPFSRSHFEPGTFVHEGRLVICGGRANKIGLAAVSAVTSYDPVTDAWTQLVPLPEALLAPTAQVLGDALVVTGGGPGPFAPQSDTHRRSFAAPLPAVQRLNAGGEGYFAPGSPDAAPGAWFCPDQWSTGGMTYAASAALAIAGTDSDTLYRSERTGGPSDPDEFAYSIPVENGPWRVRLHFAEIYWGVPGGGPGGPGRRVFDVLLEGQVVLDDLDINAEIGPATALVRSFQVAVLDGRLDVAFKASVDRPKVSAIEVLPGAW